MKTFTMRVGMVVFWNNWFWVVDRKQDEFWRLRALATNEIQVIPPSAFFDEGSQHMTIISEHPGNPLTKAPIEVLMEFARKLEIQRPQAIRFHPRFPRIEIALADSDWRTQADELARPQEVMP